MKELLRFKANPFMRDDFMQIGTKNVPVSVMGKGDNILVDTNTGESLSTHVVAHKRVDTSKFIKVFADYMSFTFELTKAGNKSLRVVMWALQEQGINRDLVTLDKFTHEEFLSEHSFEAKAFSYPTFARGLGELCKAKIIAKHVRHGDYFINPACIFNGNRIAFTTVIETNSAVKSSEESGQQCIE